MIERRHLVALSAVCALWVVSAAPTPAAASARRPRVATENISTGQPALAPACQAEASSPDSDLVERAPQLAVNPLDSNDLVAVWEQGNRNQTWDPAGALGEETVITAAATARGSDSWTQAVVPDLTVAAAHLPASTTVLSRNRTSSSTGRHPLPHHDRRRAARSARRWRRPRQESSCPSPTTPARRGPDPSTSTPATGACSLRIRRRRATAYLAYDQPIGEPATRCSPAASRRPPTAPSHCRRRQWSCLPAPTCPSTRAGHRCPR